ncbi:MAG: TIGR03790 family protein [Verrucomicrobiota bacterium]
MCVPGWVSSLVAFCLALGAWHGGLADPVGNGVPESEQVVVLYNTRVRESRSVAAYYAERRGIPSDRLIGLDCSEPTKITRDQFRKEIVEPLRRRLQELGLARFTKQIVPASGNQPGRVRERLTHSKVRYLVLVYGMPYAILDDPRLSTHVSKEAHSLQRQSGASVESDLMLMPSDLDTFAGPAGNPFHSQTNPAALHPGNGIFLVSRLDGPTAHHAEELVRKAARAERDGLWGRAYFDERSIGGGSYKRGDDWIKGAARIVEGLGYTTYIDHAPDTIPVGFPFSEVALYAGWYSGDKTGPFTLPVIEFAPGAIAYHIHSFSAADPRSPTQNWVGPLVALGATVTMGCVDEPYLEMTPDVERFFARLAEGCNVAEAFAISLPVLSWQSILVGDPLYRPFRPTPGERAAALIGSQTPGPLLPYAVVQDLNLKLARGGSVEDAIWSLEQHPEIRTSAVLAEHLSTLYSRRGESSRAVDWMERALRAGGTPQQRIRLFLDMAALQEKQRLRRDAFATRDRFLKEFPKHPLALELLDAMRRDAEALGMDQEIPRLDREIERLKPPATKTASGR